MKKPQEKLKMSSSSISQKTEIYLSVYNVTTLYFLIDNIFSLC